MKNNKSKVLAITSIIILLLMITIFLITAFKNINRNNNLQNKIKGSWYVNYVEVYDEFSKKYEQRSLSQYFGEDIVDNNYLILNSDKTYKCGFISEGTFNIKKGTVYLSSNNKIVNYKAYIDNNELILYKDNSIKIHLFKKIIK